MKYLYRTRPYERLKAVQKIMHNWHDRIVENILNCKGSTFKKKNIKMIVRYDTLPIYEDVKKPKS